MTEHPRITLVKVYRDDADEWRFTAYASNGKAIAVASEGYINHLDAVGAATGSWPDAEIKTEDDDEDEAPPEPIPGQTTLTNDDEGGTE